MRVEAEQEAVVGASLAEGLKREHCGHKIGALAAVLRGERQPGHPELRAGLPRFSRESHAFARRKRGLQVVAGEPGDRLTKLFLLLAPAKFHPAPPIRR